MQDPCWDTARKVHLREQKLLGVRWDIATDQLVINLDEIGVPTKRNIVALVGRFYDPLGLLAPIVVQFKMFFQELCEAKLEWDQPLLGKLQAKWHSLSADLQEGQLISIPRCYLSGAGGRPGTANAGGMPGRDEDQRPGVTSWITCNQTALRHRANHKMRRFQYPQPTALCDSTNAEVLLHPPAQDSP